MSSILTNNGAMVALQTLKSINKNLGMTQSQISTGKSVATAKDNSAVWAISKVMDSDVQGFEAISDSLALGESTVAVAANAAETVTDLLTDMKGRIVAAQEENVNRDAIQADIVALRDQIQSVVSAAQFNGLNLVDGTSEDGVSILSSLDRSSDGTVTASNIDVSRQNLSTTTPVTAQAFGNDGAMPPVGTNTIIDAAGANALMTIDDAAGTGTVDTAYADGTGVSSYDDTIAVGTATGAQRELNDGDDAVITIATVTAGNGYRITLDDLEVGVTGGGTANAARTFEYVAGSGDGTATVAQNLADQMNAFFGVATDSAEGYSVAVTGDNMDQLTITNGSGGAAADPLKIFIEVADGGVAGSSASEGGLGTLQNIDVTTTAGATSALTAIDELITQSIDAAAAFGSVQNRIETQGEFVSKLTDSLKSGIGSLVDADMEQVSARLQALQTQQQLGIQSLSIANQAPQSILSLFR